MSQSLFKNLASHDRTRQSIKYRKSQRARESLMLLTNEREETANSHTCAHMHTPNWTNWKLSLLWKAVFYVFFAQTTRSVISPVFKFCLCDICWFQLISDLFRFDSVFTAFVVSTCFQLCHDRARDVYRDPSFLFPKAPKKKRAEAVSVASLRSVHHETKWGPCGASLTFALWFFKFLCVETQKMKVIFQKQIITESLFWMELMSVCVLKH